MRLFLFSAATHAFYFFSRMGVILFYALADTTKYCQITDKL